MLKEVGKQSGGKCLRSKQYGHVQHIRHKLLTFVNALQNHVTSNALQASWRLFKKDLENVKTMDELNAKHTKYLKKVSFLCMLNKQSFEFYLRLEDVFVLIIRFYT